MHCEDVTAQKVTYMARTGSKRGKCWLSMPACKLFSGREDMLNLVKRQGLYSRIHSLFTSAFEEFLRA